MWALDYLQPNGKFVAQFATPIPQKKPISSNTTQQIEFLKTFASALFMRAGWCIENLPS
jgi:hypothetical protein